MNELMRRRMALMAAQGGGTVHGTWEDLFYHIDKGDYSAEYSVGEILPLDLGAEGVINAQIVAFDADALPNSFDKAPVTFVAEKLCNTKTRFNPQQSVSAATYIDGQGGVGGWEKCELRAYVQNTILPLIPASVSSRMLVVEKVSLSINTDGTKSDITTTDKIWVPSLREMFTSRTRGEQSGPHYSFFDNSENRKKANENGDKTYWLRTAYRHDRAESVLYTGAYGSAGENSNSLFCPLIGFCVG